MINRIFFTLILLLPGFSIFAQSYSDALRYSYFEVGGTARTVGAGGSMGALGTDFAVLSINPAGMAWNRKSEFVFTPAILFTNITSSLENDKNSRPNKETNTNFNINNFGFIVASRPAGTNWSTFNFGIGLNRLANFNRGLFFTGVSMGSITDRFLELSNSDGGLDQFESGVAADAEAIYDLNEDGFYESDFQLNPNAELRREQLISSEGAINELVFSLAGNYREKLMVGMTLGVPFVNFREEKVYREEDIGDGPEGDVPFFDDLTYRESLNTTGTGINFKLGFIYRADQAIRLGFAVHSPTLFRLQDNFTTSMDYNFTLQDGEVINGRGESPDGLFDYKLNTPWRLIGSGAFIIKKSGFVSAEVEWVDYGNNKFDFSSFPTEEDEANDGIRSSLASALNIRFGGEYAQGIFRLRAGLGIHQSPLEGDDTINYSYSGGIGIREKSVFLDLAVRYSKSQETFVPYLTSEAPQQFVNTDILKTKIMLTGGVRF